jgi:NAD(P)-dependent dehydrogenase (short-subunit alcohol dehydrogenase family)
MSAVGRLADKVVLITGAAMGQGRRAAVRMAEEGAAVALMDVVADGLQETAQLVRAVGGAVVTRTGSVTDRASIEALVSTAMRELGSIDVLYNNAGIVVDGTLEETTVEGFDRLMHVNCLGQLLAIQCVLPEMRRAAGGSIVNVSSVGGLIALPRMAAYCASKAAVIGLTRGVAYECAEDGIRCNVICPGGVDTPMSERVLANFPERDAGVALLTGRQLFKRMAAADEIVEVAIFLASDASSFMTGAVVPVDAGATAA